MMSILTPVRGDGNGGYVLALGIAFGKVFGGHLDVIHAHARPEDLLPYGVPVSRALKEMIVDSARKTSEGEEGRTHDLFREFCASHNLEEVDERPKKNDPGQVTATWREVEGKQASIVAVYGRLNDLVIVANPDRVTTLGMNTFQASLFEVGALTAVAPKREVDSVLEHVAIGWNGSAEAARAVKRSLRFLFNAKKVTIISGLGEHDFDLGPEALQSYLAGHAIEAGVKTVKVGSQNSGARLLETATEVGADTLVMGAFGTEKRQKFVLGGATGYVLENAQIPLLMAH